MGRESAEFAAACWAEMTTTLAAAAGAELIVTGLIFEQPAVNVAEYHGIPLATLHFFPVRAHDQLLSFVPASVSRAGLMVNDWLIWRGTRKSRGRAAPRSRPTAGHGPSVAQGSETGITGNPGL